MNKATEDEIKKLIRADKLGRNEIINIVGCTPHEYNTVLSEYIDNRKEEKIVLENNKVDPRYLDKNEMDGCSESFMKLLATN